MHARDGADVARRTWRYRGGRALVSTRAAVAGLGRAKWPRLRRHRAGLHHRYGSDQEAVADRDLFAAKDGGVLDPDPVQDLVALDGDQTESRTSVDDQPLEDRGGLAGGDVHVTRTAGFGGVACFVE